MTEKFLPSGQSVGKTRTARRFVMSAIAHCSMTKSRLYGVELLSRDRHNSASSSPKAELTAPRGEAAAMRSRSLEFKIFDPLNGALH